MAKSLRSKVKRSFRSQKRESGVYAATEAARLNRLNAKLMSIASNSRNDDTMAEEQEQEHLDSPVVDDINEKSVHADEMDLDKNAAPLGDQLERISTHGPRGSRREMWRISKGKGSKARRKGTNRSGAHNRKVDGSKTKRH